MNAEDVKRKWFYPTKPCLRWMMLLKCYVEVDGAKRKWFSCVLHFPPLGAVFGFLKGVFVRA
jgi:hypothetical protein